MAMDPTPPNNAPVDTVQTPSTPMDTVQAPSPPMDAAQTPSIPGMPVDPAVPDPSTMTDIVDIKPLVHVDTGLPWAFIAGGIAALIALALLIAWLVRRRRNRPLPYIPMLPPDQKAMAALHALKGQRPSACDQRAVHRYYVALSEIIRVYIEDQFDLNATDLTTEEIIQRLRAQTQEQLSREAQQRLIQFLRDTDQVKFADHLPSDTEINAAWAAAEQIIVITRPHPVAERTGQGRDDHNHVAERTG